MDPDELKNQDDYTCFNFTLQTSYTASSRHGSSLIKFEQISCVLGLHDVPVFYCLSDNAEQQTAFVLTHAAASENQPYNYNDRFRESYDSLPGASTGVGVILPLIVISVLVLTGIRGRCCFKQRTLFATAIAQPAVTVPQPPAYEA